MTRDLVNTIIDAYLRLHHYQKKSSNVKTYLFPRDVNIVYGHDQDGYYVLERRSIHADGTPDEFEKTYYIPAAVHDGVGIEGMTYLDEGDVLKMLEEGETE